MTSYLKDSNSIWWTRYPARKVQRRTSEKERVSILLRAYFCQFFEIPEFAYWTAAWQGSQFDVDVGGGMER